MKKAEVKKDDDSLAAAGPNPGEKSTKPGARPADKPDRAARDKVRRDDSKRKTDPASAPKSSAVGSTAGSSA